MKSRIVSRFAALTVCFVAILASTPALGAGGPRIGVVAAPPAARPSADPPPPQFLHDLPDLGSSINDASNWTIGGGYLYWASACSSVDSGDNGSLHRWPINGGRVVTLAAGKFCAGANWAADDSGLYYADGGNIYRRSAGDPLNPVVVEGVNDLHGHLVLDRGSIYWIDGATIWEIVESATFDPDPRYNDPIQFIGDAGPNANNLIVSGGYVYWFGNGHLLTMALGCVNSCKPTDLATDPGVYLANITQRFYPGGGYANPLWVAGPLDLGYAGSDIRGYDCDGGFPARCSDSSLYSAPTRQDKSGTYQPATIGQLATDGRFLFWEQNIKICNVGQFGRSCTSATDGSLMKWDLKQNLYVPGPFADPQPIVYGGVAPFAMKGVGHVATAEGWVYFDMDNGIGRIRADAPPLTWDFSADSYELTQGVQDLNNSVPLVANKPTFMRFYARKLNGPTALTVEAGLYGARPDGTPLPGSPLRPINGPQPFTADNVTPNRGNANEGSLFQLPNEWTNGGSIKLTPVIDARHEWNDTNRSNNALPERTFNFTAKAPDCIVTIPVRTHAPAARNDDPSLYRMANMVRRFLPTPDIWIFHQDDDVAQLEGRFGIPPWKYEPYAIPARDDNILSALALRNSFSDDPDQCDNANAITHYVGIINDQTDTGVELGLGERPGDVLWVKLIDQARLDRVTQDWTVQGFNTLAHELSHNYGRMHVNCGGAANTDPNYPYTTPMSASGPNCVIDDGKRNGTAIANNQRFYGFDISTLQPVDPTTVLDYMGYGAQTWVSDYTWRGVFGAISNHGAPVMAPAAAELATAGQVLYVSGIVDGATGTGSLDPIWSYPTAGMSPGLLKKAQQRAAGSYSASHATPAADSYHARLRDAAGSVLDDRTVVPIVTDDEPGTARSFMLTLPAPSGEVARVELMNGDQVLATLAPGTHAPTVSILSPAGGETIDNSMTVSWRAADSDPNDKLVFNVQYSPDNGKKWRTLLTNYPNPGTSDLVTVTLGELSGIPGSTTGGLIRVAASDGYHTTLAVSQPFTVANRAPRPHIDQPGTTPLQAGTTVALQGSATDAEDGGLSGDSLRWSLDGVEIGRGAQPVIQGLAPGHYTLTLTARDTKGAEGATSQPLTIAPLQIPLGTAPVLGAGCSDPAFANAAHVGLAPFADGSSAHVQLVRSPDALWVCFTGMPRTGGTSPGTLAGVRVDTTFSRTATPQAGDYLFLIGEDGTIKLYAGQGGSYGTLSPTGVTGRVAAGDAFWTATLRIDANMLGGWGHVVGLDVEQAWVNASGDDYFWPHHALWNNPSTWAATVLGETPQATALNPPSVPVGSATTTVRVMGSGFISGTQVLWNGTAQPTTLISSTAVEASIDGAAFAKAGSFAVAVANPGLGAAPSNSLLFTVDNPVPHIDGLSLAGKTLTVTGSGFTTDSTVIWSGVQHATTIVNPTTLRIDLNDAELVDANTREVTVSNPGPGGGLSNIATFGVGNGGTQILFVPIVMR